MYQSAVIVAHITLLTLCCSPYIVTQLLPEVGTKIVSRFSISVFTKTRSMSETIISHKNTPTMGVIIGA